MARTQTESNVKKITPEGFKTRSQVKAELGIDTRTLRRWQAQKVFVATHGMTMGNLWVWLYDEDDMKKLKELKSTRKAGRKSEA